MPSRRIWRSVIDIVNEEVQRPHALPQPALDAVPLVGRDQPGDRVEWHDPLRAPTATVHRERDPLLPHQRFRQSAPAFQFLGREFGESLKEWTVVAPDPISVGEHLVESGEGVVAEQICQLRWGGRGAHKLSG